MAIKSEAEIGILRRAARAADAALTAVMEAAREGVSEYELSALANAALFGCGAEETAFPIALASGPRAGFKHVPPQDRRLRAGDWLYVDLGCRIQGYYSDASRNRVVGSPTREQRDFCQANLEIVHACVEAMRPGVAIGDIAGIADRVAREPHRPGGGHGLRLRAHAGPHRVRDGVRGGHVRRPGPRLRAAERGPRGLVGLRAPASRRPTKAIAIFQQMG
jgi:Xaa-Pro aminopeptidase